MYVCGHMYVHIWQSNTQQRAKRQPPTNFVKRTCKIKSRLDSISMSSTLVGHLVGVAKCHHSSQLPTTCPHSPTPASACLLACHVDVAYRQSKHSYLDSVYCRVLTVPLPRPCRPFPSHSPSPASANLYLKTLEIEIAAALA